MCELVHIRASGFTNNVSAAEDFDVIAGVLTDTQFNPNEGIRIVNVRKRKDITLDMVTADSRSNLMVLP